MEITIGANIKRLRVTKSVTQEQLAEAMNVTPAAVSKWERGETYPDITLLQPLAYYFGVTLDDLMGYDEKKVDQTIEELIAEFWRVYRQDWRAANKLIEDAYRVYPNDYRVMFRYMWSRGVNDAEPDLDLALKYKDEFTRICDKIIGGCTDGHLRLGAWKMKAILLHAEGKTEEALQIHTNSSISAPTNSSSPISSIPRSRTTNCSKRPRGRRTNCSVSDANAGRRISSCRRNRSSGGC